MPDPPQKGCRRSEKSQLTAQHRLKTNISCPSGCSSSNCVSFAPRVTLGPENLGSAGIARIHKMAVLPNPTFKGKLRTPRSGRDREANYLQTRKQKKTITITRMTNKKNRLPKMEVIHQPKH